MAATNKNPFKTISVKRYQKIWMDFFLVLVCACLQEALWLGTYAAHCIISVCCICVYLLQWPVIITVFWLDVSASLQPDVGMLLFHWGANIHWGSLTGQMTSSWFDRGVIISSKPLPPPLPSSLTPPSDRDKIPKTSHYSQQLFSHAACFSLWK